MSLGSYHVIVGIALPYVNWLADETEERPYCVPTMTSTAPAPCGGAVAVIEESEFTVNEVAGIPPNETLVAPVKPVPVIVTTVPNQRTSVRSNRIKPRHRRRRLPAPADALPNHLSAGVVSRNGNRSAKRIWIGLNYDCRNIAKAGAVCHTKNVMGEGMTPGKAGGSPLSTLQLAPTGLSGKLTVVRN